MLTLNLEDPAEIMSLIRALTRYMAELPELPEERPGKVLFTYDEAGPLTMVTVELDEAD